MHSMVYLLLIVLCIIKFGQALLQDRSYFKNYYYLTRDQNCPDLHVQAPGMDPHYCVSYSEICQNVTEIGMKFAQNGTQYMCHPKFQPFAPGKPILDDQNFLLCGYQDGIVFIMELLPDNTLKYYCKYIDVSDYKNCQFATIYKGNLESCKICKLPFEGRYCSKFLIGYDNRFTNPPKKCKYYCTRCNDPERCDACPQGFSMQTNFQCLNCAGASSCTVQNGILLQVLPCLPSYYQSGSKCLKCMWYCESCGIIATYDQPTCYNCLYPGFLVDVNPDIYGLRYCHTIFNCPISNQIISFSPSHYLMSMAVDCSRCELGQAFYYYDRDCSQTSTVNPYCFHYDKINSKCLICIPGYLNYNGDDPNLKGTCIKIECSPDCLTCLTPQKYFQICTSCKLDSDKPAYDKENGKCVCQQPYGLKLEICTPCIEGYCQDCLISDFYHCTSCKPESNRILVNNQCVCQPGQYDPLNDDQLCIACDQSCLTCNGASNSQCTSCLEESISNRILIGNICLCKPGYGEHNPQESFCGNCNPRCKTCLQAPDGTDNQYCLTCVPGQNRKLSETMNCVCQDNYGDKYGTFDVCFLCHYTCGECDDLGPQHCTICSESSNRYLTSLNECLCLESYYDNLTQDIECQRCHISCKSCSNSSEKDACQQCPLTRVPSNPAATQFECVCASEHLFDDGFQSMCQECYYTCLTCNGPLSSNCLSCDQTYRQLDFQSCVCPIGHYDVGQLQCEKCHYSCHKCFDITVDSCIACSFELQFRVLKGNTCQCGVGYYEESDIAECKQCSYRCETCETSADKCLSCPFNSLRQFDSQNSCICTGELYDQENEIICQKCHFKCKTCNANSEQSCLSCDEVAFRELKNNQCTCLKHYFELNVQECAICSQFCYECINTLDKCTSCNNDRYLVGSTCQCITKLQGAEISTFEFNGLVKCQRCHYSCGTCGGIEEKDCLSCLNSDHRYQTGNSCVCKEGYFDNGTAICEKCSYKCKACRKQSESCLSCQDNSLRLLVSGFNKCQCIQRYYDDGQNEVCKECHFSCLRCNEIKTKCELCSLESNRTYNDQLFTCDCNIGYYDAGVEICQKCHYSCLSCNAGDDASCVSCLDQDSSFRVYYNNACKCLSGYYDNGQSTSCKPCAIQCLTCINQSYQCLSCPLTRKIETNCKCEQGYYDIGLQICSKCNQNCMNCESTSSNCISCDPNQFRELNVLTKTCDCQIGYLEINGICEKCNQNCKQCSQQQNNCTTCVQYRYLKNNDCICNDGMFESSLDKICKLCDKTCQTCAYSNTFCLTCSSDNFRIFKSGNICECIEGYFENPVTSNCEPCSQSCQTCSLTYDNCLTCDSKLNLKMQSNKCVCSESYFFDSLNKECKQCETTCLECQNYNECTQCRLTTRHLDQDQKKCICNDGYFETNKQNCQQCHYSCETCQNTNEYCLSCQDTYFRSFSNNHCLCIEGYYDIGTELCQKCNDVCKTCETSASTCLSCYEIEQIRFLSGDKCLCKSGYFESNTQICSKCSNECLTCQGQPDYCTSCDIDSKRVDQSIIHKCPCLIGFYQDHNQTCQKCHIKCLTCINYLECLSCKFELNSKRKGLSNQCNCQDGYFDDGTQLQCQKCHKRCKTCENDINNCLICSSSIRIIPPQCKCQDGYYEDQQFMCQMCEFQCNTCVNLPSNCLTCNQGRVGNDCKCLDGYFENGSIFCEQCSFRCATCNFNPQNCQTCKSNRIQAPQCICQPGYFDDLQNEDCQLCNNTCLECNIKGCLSCNANRVLNEEMECVPPPNSIWYDYTPWCSTCQVAVVKVYLSDDISKIIIHFDFLINEQRFNTQVEINQCLQLFELQSVQLFGQNANCYLDSENNQNLIIELGQNPKIKIGDQLFFNSNSLSHINCETALQKFFFTALQMPSNPHTPIIEYIVPVHKLNPYSENFVYLKSIQNSGNRGLENINWSCEVVPQNDNTLLMDYLDQINFLQESNLLIPKFILPKESEIKFMIQFQNFVKVPSSTHFTLYTHAGDLPKISVFAKQAYFVYETISIRLSVGTLNEQNLPDVNKYNIQFYELQRLPEESLSSKLNFSTETNSFETIQTIISKHTLSPNTIYTFQVNATNLMTNKYQIQNLTIKIPFAGLKCQFSNKGMQSIRQDLNLYIQCKDLDTKYEWNNDPDLFIQVVCKDLSYNRTCQNEKKQIIQVNSTDPFQFIKKNSIPIFTIQEWTVNVTKFQQSSKFVLIIVYLEDDYPLLELEFNQGYIMRKINNYEQMNFTFLIPFSQKNKLVELSIAIIYNYQTITIMQPQVISHLFKISNMIQEFNFGDIINLKFSAQYVNNIVPSFNNLNLVINQPPLCERLTIIRSSDLALSDIKVSVSCEQSDDFPYKYQLRLFLRELDLTEFLAGLSDNSLIIKPFQSYNQFSIQAPTSVDSSQIGLLIQVLDDQGSMTYVYEKITQKPAQINCSQIQYNNLSLQNQVALLFEAINQKCKQLHTKMFFDMLTYQISSDKNDNILKFQAIKLYKQQLILQSSQTQSRRFLDEQINNVCYDLNSSHIFITQNSTNIYQNITQKIENLKQNSLKVDTLLKYFIELKKISLEELNLNSDSWNEEQFQQYQQSQDALRSLVYFVDEIFSDISSLQIQDITIYQIVIDLLKYINLVAQEIQNEIMVNKSPFVLEGKEINWKIKRRTRQQFNQQFNFESISEDYLIDFVQYESRYFQTNPLKFSPELDKILQKNLNDTTLHIYPKHFYQIQLKNMYKGRFIAFEDFLNYYGIQFGSYKICPSNITEKVQDLKCYAQSKQYLDNIINAI